MPRLPWPAVFLNLPRHDHSLNDTQPDYDLLEYDAGVPKGTSAHAKDRGAYPSGLETNGVSLTPAVFSFHMRAVIGEKERITHAVAIHAL